MKKFVLPLLLVSLAILVSGCATAPAGGGGTQTSAVTINNFAFSPSTITVSVGTTVTWTNNQNVQHTVTSDSGSELASQPIQPGQTYSHTFSTAGTYAYHCSIHTSMHGTVIVQ